MSCMMKDKKCCEGGEMSAGCYHDHCTGPKTTYHQPLPTEEFDFLDNLPDDADNYEVQKFDDEEDEGCEGGGCKI